VKNIATWIREKDEELFHRFFTYEAGVTLRNARVEPVDPDECDALLLTGGPDISAEFLRQPDIDASLIEDPEPERDAWEFRALASAIDHGKPILAICKGVQVLNVGLGGTLHLDIPGHALPETKFANTQPLRFAPGASPQFPTVNSSHHQALDRLGDGLEVEAWSAADGIVEQVRRRGEPYVMGVQYHPERDSMYQSLFDDFLRHVRS
jgi:putative glutamine amidotransferase